MLAFELIKDGYPSWLALLPPPLILGSLIFGPCQILLARWRWPKVFYLMTDRGLYSSCGRVVDLDSILDVKMKRLGRHLASLQIRVEDDKPFIVYCIEQPNQLVNLLQPQNGRLRV